MVKIRKHSIRHNFISVQDTETICACIVGFLLSSNSDYAVWVFSAASWVDGKQNWAK